MNTFYAHYTNMDDDKEIVRLIQFDFLDMPEKEICKQAIEKAFELKQENESFYMLETIQII